MTAGFMDKVRLVSFSSDRELAEAVAVTWLEKISAANAANTALHVAISGGRIARTLFGSMAKFTEARRISLDAVEFFWADERCVPPTDIESNYRVANELLFAPLALKPDKIHRVRGEDSPDSAAAEAEAELCRIASLDGAGQPILDLVLLGMGEDGHVASLFPGEPESVMANSAAYRAVTAVKPPPRRITLGYAVLAAAREVWVLASGSGKEATLRESLSRTGSTPLAHVIRSRSHTTILTDLRLP